MDSEYRKIGRVLSLYDRLSSGKIIYLKDEINTTGVSDRSFKRDITELRNYLAEKAADGEGRKEIVYDRNRNCYYMTEEKNALSDYQEIFAIAKILLGSKGLSRVEMDQAVEYLLSLCSDESKRTKYWRVTELNYVSRLKSFRQWSLQGVDLSKEYYILFNVDSEGSYTGIVKIVKKTKATVKQWATIRIKANPEDWIYYEKG